MNIHEGNSYQTCNIPIFRIQGKSDVHFVMSPESAPDG